MHNGTRKAVPDKVEKPHPTYHLPARQDRYAASLRARARTGRGNPRRPSLPQGTGRRGPAVHHETRPALHPLHDERETPKRHAVVAVLVVPPPCVCWIFLVAFRFAPPPNCAPPILFACRHALGYKRSRQLMPYPRSAERLHVTAPCPERHGATRPFAVTYMIVVRALYSGLITQRKNNEDPMAHACAAASALTGNGR